MTAERPAEVEGRFIEAAVLYVAGGRGQPLVDAAAQALADGLDSPTLRMLAGAPRVSAEEEAFDLAAMVFDELGLDIPERLSETAYIAGAVFVGKRFLAGTGVPRDVAQTLYSTSVAAGHPAALAAFSGLDDWYDMLDAGVISGSADEIDQATVECVTLFCSQCPPQIAELVQRSFFTSDLRTDERAKEF
jgi:hypothetical protein